MSDDDTAEADCGIYRDTIECALDPLGASIAVTELLDAVAAERERADAAEQILTYQVPLQEAEIALLTKRLEIQTLALEKAVRSSRD